MSKEVETKIKKEISKHPGFANEESILSERMNELQSKFELFEDEILRRTKDLISNFKNLKKDQLIKKFLLFKKPITRVIMLSKQKKH